MALLRFSLMALPRFSLLRCRASHYCATALLTVALPRVSLFSLHIKLACVCVCACECVCVCARALQYLQAMMFTFCCPMKSLGWAAGIDE